MARPDKQVVTIVGDFGFQFCMEAMPVAVMYNVPFLCVVLNNGYLGLIRQAEKYLFDMDYEVQTWYEHAVEAESVQLSKAVAGRGRATSEQRGPVPENRGRGFDFVKFAGACGAMGERVTEPADIKAAFKRGVASGVPYIVEIILERDTDCSMGVAIDAIREFE